jgi:hypothetical protein
MMIRNPPETEEVDKKQMLRGILKSTAFEKFASVKKY